MDTRFLEQRRQGWYVVLDVPPKLRAAVGRKRLRVSLKTRAIDQARQRRWPALERLREQLTKAVGPNAGTDADVAMDRLIAAGLNARAVAAGQSAHDQFLRLERGDTTGFWSSQDDRAGEAMLSPLGIAHAAVEQEFEELIEKAGAAAAGAYLAAAHGHDVAVTFQYAAGEYIAAHRVGWRAERHAAEWQRTLAVHVFPIIGDLAPRDVGVGEVLKVLGPMWARVPVTGGRVRGRIESVLDYCTTRGWRSGENPARWKGHLEHLLPKVGKVKKVDHRAALPWQQVPAFMTALRGCDGPAFKAMEFAILTAARTGEVIGATWAEIDLDGRMWVVPAGRMKAGREHRVPLSDAAVAVLRGMRERRLGRHGEWIFPASRGVRAALHIAAMGFALGRVPGVRAGTWGKFTVHGFRSTFRDWLAECTEYGSEVGEAALAHVNGNAVERAYKRSDLFERRKGLMTEWAAWCGGNR